MGWQVNNGLEQLGTFYPAAQFHKAFYRPDVIQRVLAEGSVAKAREAADKDSGEDDRSGGRGRVAAAGGDARRPQRRRPRQAPTWRSRPSP